MSTTSTPSIPAFILLSLALLLLPLWAPLAWLYCLATGHSLRSAGAAANALTDGGAA